MRIVVPVYAEETRRGPAAEPRFHVRPLFFRGPSAASPDLDRALRKLAQEVRRFLVERAREPRHEALAHGAFCPDLQEHRLHLTLALRKRAARCRFLFVTFRALGTRIAFTPALPDLWFTVDRGQTLAERATEVLSDHFRAGERRAGPEGVAPEDLSLQGKALVLTLDLDVRAQQTLATPAEELFAFLGGPEAADGAQELEKVGHCLDRLYPDDLHRVVFRDREVDELSRLLRDPAEKRPVLVLGPRGVGKTAVIHEHVYRTVDRRRRPHASDANTWLLAPPRLISGMAVVGQWEQRVLAILQEATARHHTLYFADVLGLYRAGVTRDSRLCVAHVLKPYVERGDVRLLAEMTHEAFRVLQETDRGFADSFHVLRIAEPDESTTVRILLHVQRRLEARHRCAFGLDVLPAALDLQRRYVHDVAAPGRTVAFLERLAATCERGHATREHVLDEFHATSGLSLSFLDDRQRLDRGAVVAALRREIVGQDEAVQAMADVVCIAKARLNDPCRPLGTLLFLGPTGVGKTQCAKSLARCLFGHEDRLLRIDMNEYVAPAAVARLVGTLDEPEGQLTGAVRRQPFAVVLLDEIEKAHRAVADVLLQVLGEGRLTDALGRTVDFTNTIIIMTSNLGVGDAGAGAGFRGGDAGDRAVFLDAAERFFRPEFFNRIDRVVPFASLSRANLRAIASLLLRAMFAREGFVRRRCVLEVHPQALERVVDQGYHPRLGARALKRAMESQVAQPVAARLAPLQFATPVVLTLYPARAGVAARVEPLVNAPAQPTPVDALDLDNPRTLFPRLDAALNRIADQIAPLSPGKSFDSDTLRSEHFRYFVIRDLLRHAKAARLRLQASGRPRPRSTRPRPGRPRGSGHRALSDEGWVASARHLRGIWHDLFATEEIHDYFRGLLAAGRPSQVDGQRWQTYHRAGLRSLVLETALLHAIARPGPGRHHERALVHLRALDETGRDGRRLLHGLLARLFHRFCLDVLTAADLGLDAAAGDELLVLEGSGALRFAQLEEGTHLFCPPRRNVVPVQVAALPAVAGADVAAALRATLAQRDQWVAAMAAGRAALDDDPRPLRPVVRVYDPQGATLDLRTGLLVDRMPTDRDLRDVDLALLPLPPELLAAHGP